MHMRSGARLGAATQGKRARNYGARSGSGLNPHVLRLQRSDGLSAVERNAVALVTAGLVASGNQTAYLHNNGHRIVVVVVDSARSRGRTRF